MKQFENSFSNFFCDNYRAIFLQFRTRNPKENRKILIETMGSVVIVSSAGNEIKWKKNLWEKGEENCSGMQIDVRILFGIKLNYRSSLTCVSFVSICSFSHPVFNWSCASSKFISGQMTFAFTTCLRLSDFYFLQFFSRKEVVWFLFDNWTPF